MEQREQKPNLFGLCRVATEEGEANAAWGGVSAMRLQTANS